MKHLLTLWAALSMFCAGNPVVRTPYLDRLAGDGFRFTQNVDLAPEKPAWRTEFFYEHAIIGNVNKIPASEALVRKDWKYFYWPDFKLEQLFHVAADSFEENDLASDPAQATRLAEMRARFAELKSAAK